MVITISKASKNIIFFQTSCLEWGLTPPDNCEVWYVDNNKLKQMPKVGTSAVPKLTLCYVIHKPVNEKVRLTSIKVNKALDSLKKDDPETGWRGKKLPFMFNGSEVVQYLEYGEHTPPAKDLLAEQDLMKKLRSL